MHARHLTARRMGVGLQVHKAKKRLRATFAATKFPDCPILPVSAKVGLLDVSSVAVWRGLLRGSDGAPPAGMPRLSGAA